MELLLVLFVLEALCLYRIVAADGTILKCLTQEEDTIRIKCPHRYVIFNPSVVAGIAENNDTCSLSTAHCTGLTNMLEKQLTNCHWRRQCNIKFTRNDTLQCGQQPHVRKEAISFVKIKQPYCIPKDIIINLPKKKMYKVRKQMGVIRSHKKYPRDQIPPLRPRIIRINIRQSHTLFMDFYRPRMCGNKTDVLLRRVKNGRRSLVKDILGRKLIFHWNDTDYLELTVGQAYQKKPCLGGFIVPFSSYRTASVAELMEWPKASYSVIRDLEWIFEVRAVIEHCMVDSTGKAFLTCKEDEVIYSPEFSVAGYTRYQPTCIFGKYPCGGHTPMTLVQRNSCYWKSACPVTWNGHVPILASKLPSCVGHAASVIGLYGHRCVPREQVYDICFNCSKTIKADWGIIRSHPTYPWFYNHDLKYSKRIIQIGRGNKLLVIVQDMNLDPDGRDKFTLVHRHLDGNALPMIRDERRIVMRTKGAQSGVKVEVSEGTLDVNLRTHRLTKGGRGFVLVFKKYKKSTSKTFDKANGSPQSSELLGDATKPVRLRMNRRRCSGKGRRRRRGRACQPRVWTDFFTQLER